MKYRARGLTSPFVVAPLLAACFSARSVRAQEVNVEKFVLDNGLQVILHEDHALPIATVNLWYYVGSKDERKGRSGFAHLFEHLMFMGTKRVPGSGFDERMEAGGGANNASTSSDRTNYFSWGPSTLLPTLLWLEADRMEDFGKALTQEKLDKQRDVVRNERRQTIEMRPYGKAQEFQGELLYPPGHGYHKSVIGSHEDLEAASVQDVQDFFATFYVPNNASLVVAGDFDPVATKQLIERLFGSLPRSARVPRKTHVDRPFAGTQRWTGYDRVQFPRITTVWKTIKLYAPLDAELDLVAGILAGSKSARLYKRLVVEEKLASEVTAYQWSRLLSGQFHIEITARPDADRARIENIVTEEITKLAENGPTKEELARQQTTYEYSFVTGLESLRDRADWLNAYNFHFGRPNMFATDIARYRDATLESVRDAARRFLTTADKVVQTVLPLGMATTGDRDEAPQGGSTEAFRFQAPERFTLSNGIEVRHWKRSTLPLVRVALQLRRGALVDSREHAGRTYLMAKMLEEGAGDRDAFAFADAQEKLGARFATRASRNDVRIEMQALTTTFPAAIELWRDAIRSPRFADEDWARVQRLHLQSLKQKLDEPSEIARDVGSACFFGLDHPYGYPLDGTSDSVASLALEDLRQAWTGLVRPELASLYIAGDIDAADAKRLLEDALGAWRVSGKALEPLPAPRPKSRTAHLYLVDRPDAVQTVVRFIMPAPTSKSPDVVRLRALNTILGGSFTSRLNANIREKHGYSYGVGSGYALWPQIGTFLAVSNVQEKFTGAALKEFLAEFEAIRTGDVRPAEARKASSTNRQALVSSMGGLAGLLGTAMALEVDGLAFSALDARMRELASLDADALNAIARHAVALDQACLVLVGNKEKILPQLEGLPLPTPQYRDASGRAVSGGR